MHTASLHAASQWQRYQNSEENFNSWKTSHSCPNKWVPYIVQTLNSQETLHSSPVRVSYGVSIMNTSGKNYHVILLQSIISLLYLQKILMGVYKREASPWHWHHALTQWPIDMLRVFTVCKHCPLDHPCTSALGELSQYCCQHLNTWSALLLAWPSHLNLMYTDQSV